MVGNPPNFTWFKVSIGISPIWLCYVIFISRLYPHPLRNSKYTTTLSPNYQNFRLIISLFVFFFFFFGGRGGGAVLFLFYRVGRKKNINPLYQKSGMSKGVERLQRCMSSFETAFCFGRRGAKKNQRKKHTASHSYIKPHFLGSWPIFLGLKNLIFP